MNTGQFLGALAAVVAAGVTPVVALAIHLGGRIDDLTKEVHQIHEDLALHKAEPRAHGER